MTLSLTFLGLMAISTLGAASQSSSLDAQTVFNHFYAVEQLAADMTPRQRDEAIDKAYRQYLQPFITTANPKDISTENLGTIFREMSTVNFFFLADLTPKMQSYVEEMHARSAKTTTYDHDMLAAFVRQRQFDQARLFAKNYHIDTISSLPDHIKITPELNGPTELTLSDDGHTLTQEPFVIRKPVDIVVVAHPLCHFSANATAYIEANPKLAKVFATHSQWVMPQDGSLTLKTVQNWNIAHPTARMSYVYKYKDWPFVDSWATPTFYFYKDGNLVKKIVGWPPVDGGEGALLNELQELDLLK